MFTIIDEYSRFPFAMACPNTSAGSVIKCLNQLFTLCGTPNYIHSDRGSAFLSQELKEFLTRRGVATSKTTPYHPSGNGQCERYNGIIWKSVLLSLKSQQLALTQWELVLPNVLHSIRSLLSTSTNTTPHERFFGFQRRSPSGTSVPSWLTAPGKVMLRRFVRHSKTDPLVDEVDLTDITPSYAHIRHRDGRESTVALRDLAPCPSVQEVESADIPPDENFELNNDENPPDVVHNNPEEPPAQNFVRRSVRVTKAPDRLGY